MPIKNEYAVRMIDLVYHQNKKLGWHDSPRTLAQYIDLFHSEVSEATEGLRKNLMDDKLSAYPMWVVEFADYIIRVFDFLGAEEYEWGDMKGVKFFQPIDAPTDIANLHMLTSEAWLHRGSEMTYYHLQRGVCLAWDSMERAGYEPESIIMAKVAFNAVRSDHKRENRKKPGGKAW